MVVNTKEVAINEVVGKGYGSIWRYKGRYKVIKGSRGSKKSFTTALWIIYNMMKYKDSNTLVVRKVFRTLHDSCFVNLKWACIRLGVSHLWRFKTSPLEIEYIPTGQKILFRGLDDSLKITSITVAKGYLNWVWIEEAYEIMKEDDFQTIVESIRGKLPDNLFYQFIITFNPWSEKHWLKKRFFDEPDDDTLAVTTTYRCNEFLDDEYKQEIEKLKINNPRRYRVSALGEWGIIDGLVYENWEERMFDYKEILDNNPNIKPVFGLDFGFSTSYTSLFCGLIDITNKEIWVFNEVYKRGMSNSDIYQSIKELQLHKEVIIADCEDPRTISELRSLGLYRIKASVKGADSIRSGINYIQEFKIYIHPRCNNFLTEISTYCWNKDKFGETLNVPIKENDHLMDAMRYAIEPDRRARKGIETRRRIIH